jgi:crotonobetainyl-CoA:carnitine CoA-transferase CaiB-like acyl-CoA transferase
MNPVTASTALQHLRVLDLTRVRAGPTCCRIFADFGADVIQIEAPAGADPNPGMSGPRLGYDMQNLHRNKRSLTLNLKIPQGLAIFKELVKTADVVVENYRPDVKERLGITYQDLASINPRIILASISGFGQTGPYRNRAGFDQIAQGMGGLMSVTGELDGGPMRAGIAVADSSAGNFAALGIFVALAERERSGMGQWIHTSLLQAQIAMMDFQAAAYLVEGKVPRSAGNDHPYSTPTGVIPTSDGHINVAVAGEGQWANFCKAIERPDLQSHPDYAAQELRFRNRSRLKDDLTVIFKGRTSAEWLENLHQYGVPAGPINTIDQVFADPQVQHLGMAAPLEHPELGEISLVATPIVLSRTPGSVRTPTVEPGANSTEILRELGISDSTITSLRSSGAV